MQHLKHAMKHITRIALVMVLAILLSACSAASLPPTTTDLTETVPPTTAASHDATTVPLQTIITEPLHSPLYIPELSLEDVIRYFTEVCLDSEIINSGDPSYVQKWLSPIYYSVEGVPTDEDLATLGSFVNWLNQLEGFPGIFESTDPLLTNLRFCFYDQAGMLDVMGQNFTDMDGAVTFWYTANIIHDAIICCRTDLDQQLRNSVILEELYNGLGPIQDTQLRPDSIIYNEFSQPQWLSPTDELILKLLYHPDMHPGMNAAECVQIISNLYN